MKDIEEKASKKEHNKGMAERKQDISVLIIAVILMLIYFTYGLHNSWGDTAAEINRPEEQIVFEIEDHSGLSKTYSTSRQIHEKDAITEIINPSSYKTLIKNGINITDRHIRNGFKFILSDDGSVVVGLMSGEKHIIFSVPLDINQATAQDFEAFSGIGPNLAARIIEKREQLGGFKHIKDLRKVIGIGDKKFENMKLFVIVG